MSLTLLVALLGLYESAAFNLTPPSNEWSRTGSSFELVCSSSEPITTCSWDTPYEKNYNLKGKGFYSIWNIWIAAEKHHFRLQKLSFKNVSANCWIT